MHNAGQNIRYNMNTELHASEQSFSMHHTREEKEARRKAKEAEKAYQTEHGIYKPTLMERIKRLFQK